MKVCPNCQTKYQNDANFCPQETCATPQGPRRLDVIAEAPAVRYDLQSQIGGSRSGEVFQALDTQTSATVAYKRVSPASLPTPAVFERTLRELRQLQRAQSPRLARVVDFGRDPEGRLFVVSELCEGQSLDRLIAATGPLPLDRAKKIVAQIGEALLEGQKVGVVHHDLSPKNVMVDGADDVKVINFVAPVAISDTVFGIPEYLSPEQAEGKLVDQRSNTYSLGAILTLLLTGQAPVSGADTASILAEVLKGSITPPSRLGSGLTPEIDRVVLKAMDKSPNRRPLTMRQFLTDVAGLVGPGAAPAADRAGVGFAKTMMFTGGSPEIQKLVNQAMAARAEANGTAGAPTPPPATAIDSRGGPMTPAPQAATPPPVVAPVPQSAPPPAAQGLGPRRSHGAAIAATMVAMPAAKPSPSMAPGAGMPAASAAASAQPQMDPGATPPPISAAPPAGAGADPNPKPAAGGNFRETLWFKKGDVDQMVAEARARVEAARGKGAVAEEVAETPSAPTPDALPLEDRYVDDGSVTVEDRKKFSLRAGATATALPAVGKVPGERMSESELIGEIGNGKRVAVIVVAVAVVVAVVVGLVVVFRGKDVAKSATAITPVPIETTPAPAPPPPPEAPAAPAPAAAAPAKAPAASAEAQAEGAEAAPPAPKARPSSSSSSKKHPPVKKGKSSKKRH